MDKYLITLFDILLSTTNTCEDSSKYVQFAYRKLLNIFINANSINSGANGNRYDDRARCPVGRDSVLKDTPDLKYPSNEKTATNTMLEILVQNKHSK